MNGKEGKPGTLIFLCSLLAGVEVFLWSNVGVDFGSKIGWTTPASGLRYSLMPVTANARGGDSHSTEEGQDATG